MTAHSKTVGSSTAARVMACPRSYTLSKDIPNTESEYAAEGSMLHEAVELILDGKFENDIDVIGHETEWGTVTGDLYWEMVEPAIKAFDNLFDDRFEYLLEQTCRLPEDIVPDSFGTADVLGKVVAGKKTTAYTAILDWKFGRGVEVDAKNNKQLLFAASAGRATHPKYFEADTIYGIIVQPGFSPDPKVWKFTHEEVDEFEEHLRYAWQRTEEAPLKEGSHCTFCPAKAVCPAKHEKIKRIQTLNLARKNNTEKTNEFIPGMELAELMPLADEAEEWAKAVKKHVHAELENGTDIPGWKLVAKRGSRQWTDEAEAAKWLKGMRMKHTESHPVKFISAPKVETWIKANSPTKRAKTIRMARFDELVYTAKSSGTTLAPESDKRPAIGDTTEKLKKLKGLIT